MNYDDPRVIATIKQTVAIKYDAELAMFLEHCRATGLNPFKREVWFVKQNELHAPRRHGGRESRPDYDWCPGIFGGGEQPSDV